MKILIFGLPGSGKTTLAKPFAELINGVHINADAVRERYKDWDFSPEGRLRQAQRMRHLADGVLLEQNDGITRSSFNAALSGYLSEIQARRGVTDYLVVCDETNNTAEVIDRNEFVAEIFVKPTRSINYVTVTVTATKTGVSFSEVVGR